jgi:prepilin-type N-terminal cleavage/methylation domain-containing protein
VRARRPAAAGFTLLEVAIALAIMGIGVVTVLELFSAALRQERASGIRARAVVHARMLLDATVTIPEPEPREDAGDFGDGFRWERIIREAPEYTDGSGREFDLQSAWTVYEIQVTVLWDQTASRQGVYAVRTLRVAPGAGV